ncbi:MAG: hypothetical protein ACRDQX_14290 [Pseudonocardiaceae bacterium]
MAPAVAGLVGDRAIEPIIAGYGTAGDPARVPSAVGAVEQTGWPAVQRRAIVGEAVPAPRVSGPGTLATTTVQRSVSGGAYLDPQWPADALAVNRSSSGGSRRGAPTQTVQFVQFAPAEPAAVASNPPQLSATVVVQRTADEQLAAAGPPATTDSPAATSPSEASDPTASDPTATGLAAGAAPAQPGSTSPTEVDTLVNRLYDPLVQRIKAELQRDRERAGRSLDLRH